MTAPAFTLDLFLIGMILVFMSMVPGLNGLAFVGVALFIPIACAFAIDLGRLLTKDTK